ncbi:MAG: hypothetical protein ACQEVT_18385 [Pseudomonadota bacterium]
MAAINHFQRYSQRENHVTNNTMLMLRHVYRTTPGLMEDLLSALLEDDEIEIGPGFEQQVGGSHSTPDAVLIQKPLNIYIEAKRGDWLHDTQIEGHLKSIESKEHPAGTAWLVGLTTNHVPEAKVEQWRKLAKKRGVNFAIVTYRDLIGAIEAIIDAEPDLNEILEDYRSFIAAEGLLPDQHRKIVVMLCGQSWAENVAHGVYFEPESRNAKWTQAHYLGVYHNKRVSHFGRIVAAAICRKIDGELVVDTEELGKLDDDGRARISAIIDAADYFENLRSDAHRYYLVDRFAQTDIRKTSPGGMMGHRYLDIENLTGKEPGLGDDLETVAQILNGSEYS